MSRLRQWGSVGGILLLTLPLLLGGMVLVLPVGKVEACGTNVACSNAVNTFGTILCTSCSSAAAGFTAGAYEGDLFVITFDVYSTTQTITSVTGSSSFSAFAKATSNVIGGLDVETWYGVETGACSNCTPVSLTVTFTGSVVASDYSVLRLRGTANSTFTVGNTGGTASAGSGTLASINLPANSLIVETMANCLVTAGQCSSTSVNNPNSYTPNAALAGSNYGYPDGCGAGAGFAGCGKHFYLFSNTASNNFSPSMSWGVAVPNWALSYVVFYQKAVGVASGLSCVGGTPALASGSPVAINPANVYFYFETVNQAGFSGATYTSIGVKVLSDGVHPSAAAVLSIGFYVTQNAGSYGGSNPFILQKQQSYSIPVAAATQFYFFNMTNVVGNGFQVAWAVITTQTLELAGTSFGTVPVDYNLGGALPTQMTLSVASNINAITLFACRVASSASINPTPVGQGGTSLFACGGLGQCMVGLFLTFGFDAPTAGWFLWFITIVILIAIVSQIVPEKILASNGVTFVLIACLAGTFISVAFAWIGAVYGLFIVLGLIGMGALKVSGKVLG